MVIIRHFISFIEQFSYFHIKLTFKFFYDNCVTILLLQKFHYNHRLHGKIGIIWTPDFEHLHRTHGPVTCDLQTFAKFRCQLYWPGNTLTDVFWFLMLSTFTLPLPCPAPAAAAAARLRNQLRAKRPRQDSVGGEKSPDQTFCTSARARLSNNLTQVSFIFVGLCLKQTRNTIHFS